MTPSVQLRPDPRHQAQPFLSQADNLLCLGGMHSGDALEQIELVVHQPHVFDGDLSGIDHAHVAGEALPAENDALVGFFGGHRQIFAQLGKEGK